MALISCPECNREISDKVNSCPHCGYPMVEQEPQAESPQQVEVTSINLTPKNPVDKKKIIIGAVAVIVVIIGIIAAILISKSISEKKAAQEAAEARNAYIDTLVEVRYTMLLGAADAEGLCVLTHDVWYNTIYEEYDSTTDEYTIGSYGFYEDFNTSLSLLYTSVDTINTIAEIKVNRTTVDELMKELQNPTEEFTTCFATVSDLYDAYYNLTSLAISPTGSLQTYTENFNDYDSEFMQHYERLEVQIPEKSYVETKAASAEDINYNALYNEKNSKTISIGMSKDDAEKILGKGTEGYYYLYNNGVSIRYEDEKVYYITIRGDECPWNIKHGIGPGDSVESLYSNYDFTENKDEGSDADSSDEASSTLTYYPTETGENDILNCVAHISFGLTDDGTKVESISVWD